LNRQAQNDQGQATDTGHATRRSKFKRSGACVPQKPHRSWFSPAFSRRYFFQSICALLAQAGRLLRASLKLVSGHCLRSDPLEIVNKPIRIGLCNLNGCKALFLGWESSANK
jgi:hypothetical protein